MKYKVLFSLKNNEKVFMNVVCCSRDWHFKGKEYLYTASENDTILYYIFFLSKSCHTKQQVMYYFAKFCFHFLDKFCLI